MLLLTASPSYGWGREGHQLIARLANSQLNPKAKSAVSELLDPGETLESVSTWADEIRANRPETTTWHYINIPVTAKGDWRKYCPDTDCVVSIVEKLERRMTSTSLSRKERRETLFFLVHFISDLHQPLHVGDKGDRGGNDVPTVYRNYAGNLHGTWDAGLILGYRETDPALWIASCAAHRRGSGGEPCVAGRSSGYGSRTASPGMWPTRTCRLSVRRCLEKITRRRQNHRLRSSSGGQGSGGRCLNRTLGS